MGGIGAKSSGVRRVLDLLAWAAAAVIVGGLIANASPGPRARPSPEPTRSVAPSTSPAPSASPSPRETSPGPGAPESVVNLSVCEGLRALANAQCRVGANNEVHPNDGLGGAEEHLGRNQDRQDARDDGNGGNGGTHKADGTDGSTGGPEERSAGTEDGQGDPPGQSGDEHGQGRDRSDQNGG